MLGSESDRDGIGARLELSMGDRVLVREVKAGSSYLAQNTTRIHFGLGGRSRADRLDIYWQSGVTDTVSIVEANQTLTILEGSGVFDREPLRTPRAEPPPNTDRGP